MSACDLSEKDIRSCCGMIGAPKDLISEFLKAADELRRDEKLEDLFLTVQASLRDEAAPLKGFDDQPVCKSRLLAGLAVLSLFPLMNERHRKIGIDEKITRATQKDLLLWMEHEKEKSGHWGLAELGWLRKHIDGHLFRLGRLQFKSALWSGSDVGDVHCGDPVLEVHIPADGKLDVSDCLQSLNSAPEFFRRHLPDFKFKALTCDSWLLDPALQSLLPESSNIIGFQKMWTIYPSEKNEQQACERVFGQYPVDPGTAPQKTFLQIQMLHRIQQNRPIRRGAGVILPESKKGN